MNCQTGPTALAQPPQFLDPSTKPVAGNYTTSSLFGPTASGLAFVEGKPLKLPSRPFHMEPDVLLGLTPERQVPAVKKLGGEISRRSTSHRASGQTRASGGGGAGDPHLLRGSALVPFALAGPGQGPRGRGAGGPGDAGGPGGVTASTG